MTSRESFEERFGKMPAEKFAAVAYLKAWDAWQASERQALFRAIRATAQAKTTSHACDAIRALLETDK